MESVMSSTAERSSTEVTEKASSYSSAWPGARKLEDMDRAIAAGASGSENASAASLLGLMVDEPDLVDQVCSLAYDARLDGSLRDVDE
jgi:hypothetical protein